MKAIILRLLNQIVDALPYKGFKNQNFSVLIRFRCLIFQKFLRLHHSNVDWPVDKTSVFKCPEKLERGNRYPGLSKYCYFDARNGIKIGKNVWIGPYVALISMNHDINNFEEYINDEPIEIGDNCWIGARATILPGVKLKNHVIIAAGSVVTKSFEDNVIIAGVPARVIRKIDNYDIEKID